MLCQHLVNIFNVGFSIGTGIAGVVLMKITLPLGICLLYLLSSLSSCLLLSTCHVTTITIIAQAYLVPNGGFETLPESLITKQLAALLQTREWETAATQQVGEGRSLTQNTEGAVSGKR